MKAGITTTIVTVLLAAAAAFAEDPYEVAWSAQIGTSDGEEAQSVAVDACGNAYITGWTTGDLGGPNAGSDDVFLSKFNAAGNEVWTTQIGTSSTDQSYSVAADASGSVYISGLTLGDLGGPNAGWYDVFLSKFDSSGNEVWTTQIGTSTPDWCKSVALDASGDIYISGWTFGDLGGPSAGISDVFLSKFDSAGNELWTTQIGTASEEHSPAVAVDAGGNAYVTGRTWGDLGGPNAGPTDIFLSRFDSSGNEVWTTQIGVVEDEGSESVALDAAGNVYISGWTNGDLGGPNAGGQDAFLSKFDSSGNELWTTQTGTTLNDHPLAVAVDAAGGVFITGYSGAISVDYNAFLSKFDSSGNELWTIQPGTPGRDESCSVAVDAFGGVYITGTTSGDLGGPNAGGYDAFVVKYVVPEPASATLLALGAAAVLKRRRKT